MVQGGSVKLAMGRERGVKRGLVSLRIGSVNVTTMKKKDGEVVDMAARRHLDFCCLQETGWKGEGARKLGEYKFFWMGCSEGIHGVGLLVADRWIEKVLELRRVSERLMVVRVIVGRTVLNLISAYAPQAGRPMLEKKEFFTLLGKIVSEIDDGEKLLICRDLNGHVGVGAGVEGFEGVHGGFGFGKRLITYEIPGKCRTVIDYILIRKSDRKLIRDVKLIRQEECISSHKLIICVLDLKEGLNKRKMEFVKRCKVWKLRDDVTAGIFEERVQARAALVVEKPTGVEEVWKNFKECLTEETILFIYFTVVIEKKVLVDDII